MAREVKQYFEIFEIFRHQDQDNLINKSDSITTRPTGLVYILKFIPDISKQVESQNVYTRFAIEY